MTAMMQIQFSLMFLAVLSLTGTQCVPIYLKTGYGMTSAADAIQLQRSREKRDYTGQHNYAEVVYDMLQDENNNPGVWKQMNCSSIFNCETVSLHHCTKKKSWFFCSSNKVSDDCSFYFEPILESNNAYSATDLVLYKAEEPDTNSYYLVYIIYKVSPVAGYIVSYRNVSSQCNGWQVFHLHGYVTRTLVKGENDMRFRVIVFKNGIVGMSCSQISSVFLMNATYLEDAPPQVQGSGGGLGFLERTRREENSLNQTVTSDLFSIPEDKLINYIPVLNIFSAKQQKRRRRNTVDTPTHINITTESGRCYRADKIAVFDSINIEDEPHTILRPANYNVGECKVGGDGQDKDERPFLEPFSEQICVPIKFKSVEMLVRKKTGTRHLSIHRNNDIIIEECGSPV